MDDLIKRLRADAAHLQCEAEKAGIRPTDTIMPQPAEDCAEAADALAAQAAEIERLTADNARLMEDAERFVCLASHYWVQDGAFHKLDLPIGVFDSADVYMQELRAAIDSRRKESKHAE